MAVKIIKIPNYKALVVGPIYNKIDKLNKIKSLMPDYDFVIFNGNLCYPFDDLDKVRNRIQVLNEYLEAGTSFYVLGNYDLQLLFYLDKTKEAQDIQNWLQKHSNIIIVNYDSQQSLIVTCGGISPQMEKRDLLENIEISFISQIDGYSWHKWYGGGYGYIISNNPLTSGPPQFHNFSAQIGNIPDKIGQVYAQEVTPLGLGKTISL